MKKFLVLYRMDMDAMRKMMESTSEKERAESMKEWGEWMKKNMSHFADPGAPVGKNRQVTPAAAADVSNDIGGYSIVQAESIDEVVAMLKTGPHFKMPGAICDVMPVMSMDGM